MRILISLLLGAAFAAGPVDAAAQGTYHDAQLTRGTLSFDGRATLGDFTGTTTTVTGQMTGGPELTAVRGWVEGQVNTLKTGNGRRDRDLNKSMESEKYPTMRFDLAGVTPGISRGDSTALTLSGRLTLHGVTKDVTLPATLIALPGGLRLRSTFPVNLNDYQIGGLSKMLGMLKMHPDITVYVDLEFAQ